MNSQRSAEEHLAQRYELHEVLGRGGMACVQRATELSTGREVALKRLTVSASARETESATALFEREFQILMQLRHPHVISVYDYGLSEDGSAYYTMELLDGGDLLARAPMPWREVCRLMFDVCSSLALLHSRRLVHRDISPRNIRCTRDGSAKLIDFGAMAPMSSGGADVVGTPAFIAPETLHRLALDARTDLFSLGATLYYALTGRPPYVARSFAEVLDAWRYAVPPPSAANAELPAALVDLVLSMISLEPALRPQSAFDVMQRLAACAGLPASESDAVSRAYLSTPALVGRGSAVKQLRERLIDARTARGCGVMLRGGSGCGRSRMLDACTLEAKTLGFTVLRANASGAREGFAVANGLIKHLLAALPASSARADYPGLFAPGEEPLARNFSDPALDAQEVQSTLCGALERIARTRPLLIAVDDVERVDPPSAAVLATLVENASRNQLLVVLTTDSDLPENEATRVLRSRSATLPLPPLERRQTLQLFDSLFGDVAHLATLADEIFHVAQGNPRQSMDLAQHLVDRGLIHYASGIWTLPSRLAAEDLPASAADTARARLATMSAQARLLIEAHALAFYEELTDAAYRALLPDASSAEVERALTELLLAGAIVSDGSQYTLANRVWGAAALGQLTAAELQARHAALATMYCKSSRIARIHHAFSAGLHEQGLEALLEHYEHDLVNVDNKRLLEQNIGKMLWCSGLALETAQRLGHSPRAIHRMRRWHFAGQITRQEGVYDAAAQCWFEQLEHDSGLALYRADTQNTDPNTRLTQALTRAHERYLATPEAERVYAVDEAIRLLGEYVIYSIALGARTQSDELLGSLPAILEPFAALSPVLWAIWQNSIATCQSQCLGEFEAARARWLEVVAKLEPLRGGELHFIEPLINAVLFGIGTIDTRLGLASASSWAERLDHDPYQRISALQLRKIVRLQEGDAAGAERYRRQAEVLALQTAAPQMFKSLLNVELILCTKALDLTGVQRLLEETKPLAARHPGWSVNLIWAEASFQLVRGDLDKAKQLFESGVGALKQGADGKPANRVLATIIHAGLAETLLAMGKPAEARDVAMAALAWCDGEQIGDVFSDLECTLSLAEAKLGDAQGAAARLDALIAENERMGVTGLRLGLVYEARAQVAIWSADSAGFQLYAELTGRAYRHGARSSLAARYARLMHEAADRGYHGASQLTDFQSLTSMATSARGEDLVSIVSRSMSTKRLSQERAEYALSIICDAHAARAGHLFTASSAGLLASSSLASEPPTQALVDAAAKYLDDHRTRSLGLDEMITGELPEDDDVSAPRVEVAGRSYWLLLLNCSVDDVNLIAGVAALAVPEQGVLHVQQDLLRVLAAQLVRAGDTQGIALA